LDNEQPPTAHLSQQVSIHNINTQLLNTRSSKEEYKKIGEWGEYTIILKDSKKYLKHKWKDEPLKEYQ